MTEMAAHGHHDVADPRTLKLLQKVADTLVDIHQSNTQLLNAINGKVDQIMATIQELADDVAAQATIVDSVLTLVQGLSQQLADAIANGADPAALQAIKDQLDANTQRLADAVSENTPQA